MGGEGRRDERREDREGKRRGRDLAPTTFLKVGAYECDMKYLCSAADVVRCVDVPLVVAG